MHPLKSAILHHKLDDISELASDYSPGRNDPTSAELLRLALEMGNQYTIVRLARHFQHGAEALPYRQFLLERMEHLSHNHLGGGDSSKAARRLWQQVFRGVVEPSSRDEPDFVLTPGLVEDVRLLLERAGIHSEAELRLLVGHAKS